MSDLKDNKSNSDQKQAKEMQLNIAGRLGKVAMFSNLTPMISVLIFLIGVIALMVTPREENPQIDVPAANVIVQMQGASPEEVQNLIVRPLEMVLREITGVEHTYGMAMDSQAVVTVMFEVGEDKEVSLVKLYDRIMHSMDRLPAGASQPLIKPLDVDDVPVSVITLSSTEMDGLALKRLAERVRDQLAPLDGVSVVDIIGGNDRQIRIQLDPMRLAAYQIALDSVHQVLLGANAGGPSGQLVGDNREIKIWLDGYLKNATEVGRLMVGQWQNKAIYLSDVATISDGLSEVNHYHRIGFGQSVSGAAESIPAVSITLAKKRGTNAVVVTNRILSKLDILKGDFIPDNVNVTITRDSGERANAAVNYLLEHLAVAVVTVIIILLLFLGWREAAIVTMNIPLILFIVLAVGLMADQTINRITLFSLILALGLLVDDAIVVIENIHRHLKMRGNQAANSLKEKAALIVRATNETGKPTIIATIAVILAFIPMAFVTGMMGPYMGPIPFNTPIAMAASLVIAYMFTPWIAQRWLPYHIADSSADDSRGEERAAEPKDGVHRLYLRLATPLIESKTVRRLFSVIILVMFVAAMLQPGWQFLRADGINGPMTPGSVELKMLPKGNNNTFNITIDLPEGGSLEETDRIAREVAEVVRTHPMVTDYESFVGQAGPIDFNGMLRGAVLRHGTNLADIRVNLVDKHERSIRSDAIVLEIRTMLEPVLAAHPNSSIKLVEDPPGPPVRATLLAEIYGPDYQVQRQMAKAVRHTFETTYDVVDVADSVGDDQMQLNINVNKEKAAQLGVATAQVEAALRDFLGGYDFGALHVQDERHQVKLHVQLPKALRAHAEDLNRIYVSGSHGPVALSAFATIESSLAAKPIYTKDGHQVTYVMAEPKQGAQVYSLLEIDGKLDGQEVLPGIVLKTGGMHFGKTVPEDTYAYHMLWDGEMRLTLDVFRDLGAAFIVALVLIYLLMVAYYGQLILPMLVMAPTALTMIGIFPGHWITGQPFTATSMIGMIALAGIVVRNSTLLIDFILDYRNQGYDVKTAVLEAGAVRARPILLTALAVIAGTSIMISDPVFGGLGVSMAFGTLAATILTLFITPLMYYLWQRNKAWVVAEKV